MTRYHNTSINLLGLDIEVEVEYKITSYGSGPSWEHPGDPAEIEIHRVVSAEGVDLTNACNRPDGVDILSRIWIAPRDPIKAWITNPISMGDRTPAHTYRTELYNAAESIADRIEAEIFETPGALDPREEEY